MTSYISQPVNWLVSKDEFYTIYNIKATKSGSYNTILCCYNYGINSAQTNQIMTTACVIVKLQPEQFNKSIKRNKFQNYILLWLSNCLLHMYYVVNTKILHKLQSTFGSCSNFAINLWVRMHLQFLQNTYFTYFFLLSWEIHESNILEL